MTSLYTWLVVSQGTEVSSPPAFTVDTRTPKLTAHIPECPHLENIVSKCLGDPILQGQDSCGLQKWSDKDPFRALYEQKQDSSRIEAAMSSK